MTQPVRQPNRTESRAPTLNTGRSPRRRVLATAFAFAFGIQLVSATWLVSTMTAPNVSGAIARNLVEEGRFVGGYWSLLTGPEADPSSRELRAFHLPGEALYLAFWFRVMPGSLERYAHVPVTALLITAITGVALLVGGPGLALLVCFIGTLQPFTVIHGPVWDDTFLAAAVVWLILFLVLRRIAETDSTSGPSAKSAWLRLAMIAVLAGSAGLTRVTSQGILLLIAAGTFLLPSMRGARREGLAIVVGLVLALGAWGARNHAVTGELMFGSSADGVVFLLSNGPYTRRAVGYGQIDRYVTAETMGEHWANVAEMSEPEIDRYYRQATLGYMIANPMDVLGTSALKMGVTLAGTRPELPLTSLRNLMALGPNALLLLLALTWVGLGVRRTVRVHAPHAYAFGAITAVVLGVLAIGPIGWRYRITLDGVLWIAASAAFLHMARPRLAHRLPQGWRHVFWGEGATAAAVPKD